MHSRYYNAMIVVMGVAVMAYMYYAIQSKLVSLTISSECDRLALSSGGAETQ